MRFVLSVLALTLSVSGYAAAAQSDSEIVRILFIGNSLTYSNDLPGVIAKLADLHGRKIVPEVHAPGGARFYDHANNTQVMEKIRSRYWHFVVLQEQSQYPGFSREQQTKDVYPYAKHLADASKRQGAMVLFFMAMARKNGDPDNQHVSPELMTYEGMQKRVNESYRHMAEANRAMVAPVGEVWARVRSNQPELELYADDVHPNRVGTFLAACVIYETMFNESNRCDLDLAARAAAFFND